MTRPRPGTFRLYSSATPPLLANEYVIDASIDIAGVPGLGAGGIETLYAALDVVAPRFQLPPDQVLSTFPPAGSRGPFGTRLPQIVIKRRTLPWERSVRGEPPEEGQPDPDAAVPEATPWLALVLIGPGEGTIMPDVPVAQAVTDGTRLSKSGIVDTPKTSCLEVPKSVVEKTFPTIRELALLAHIREVDLGDTELAMNDDDGWLAVVLSARLPQDAGTYTVALISVEGQTHLLPDDPKVGEPDYTQIVDLGVYQKLLTSQMAFASADAPVMGHTDAPEFVAKGQAAKAYSATTSGAVWAAGTSKDAAATELLTPTQAKIGRERTLLGIVDLPYALIEPTYRFPVLTTWSFTNEGNADFQVLANDVTSRLLGYVQEGPEDPDGGPRTRPLIASVTEPPSPRPLPLVTSTGHVVMAHQSRIGEALEAYFRGPLIPYPSVRPTQNGQPDGPPMPIAHHSDQLRAVVPDGLQDLTYATAFEIGRLLALSRPGVVAMLNRWRAERFAAAKSAAVGGLVAERISPALRAYLEAADPLQPARVAVPEGLPGPQPEPGWRVATGRQFARGLLAALGEASVIDTTPLAKPGFSVDDGALFTRSRASRIATGLGIPVDLSAPVDEVATALRATPATAPTASADARLAAARSALEDAAGQLLDQAAALDARGISIADIVRRRG